MAMRPWIAVGLLLMVACGGSTNAGSVAPSPSPQAPGPRADTWSWDGSAWHIAATGGPSPRFAASLAYDAQHKTYVLFGGQTREGSSDETWLFDGHRWTAASPAHRPSARRSAAMAYDADHGTVVLFGGLVQDKAEGIPAADTWSWNGSDWTVLSQFADSVGQRLGASMVTAGGKVVLFGGGSAPNYELHGDAFIWSGSAWVSIDSKPRPPGRYGAAVSWNESDSSLFVFGGNGLDPSAGPGTAGISLADTWLLKGGAWTQAAAAGPPATGQPNALWQAKPGRVLVMFGMAGGRCRQPLNTVWAWDGTSWSQLANAPVPARWGAALAQAPDGTGLLFGGSDEPGC